MNISQCSIDLNRMANGFKALAYNVMTLVYRGIYFLSVSKILYRLYAHN